MSGKPAARQGDATMKGGPIVQGSAGVMIGAPTGVACSVCPGGRTSGSPVNPLLGAKVLPGETDIALPGPLPFMLTRSYSSYRTKTPAPVGTFGPGWKAPFDIRLQLRDDELIINDDGGRSIHFEPLLPGETAFSRSESLWLARGGVAKLHESNVLHVLWQALPEDLRLSQHLYLATNSAQGPWWILGWPERIPGADEPLPAPLPPYRVLTGVADRFGRTQTFQRDAGGEFAGNITGVTDGAGRRFRLVLTSQAQRAESARRQAAAAGTRPAPFPQTLPVAGYGADSGIRLEAVWLTHDPAYPDNLPALPLARYTYTPRGELSAVYDRSGTPVRSFTYDDKHPGRMTAHQYAGRPQTTYRYDAAGRVTEQHNPAGLSYTYGYEKNAVVITDSLNRREVLYTEGEGGLKRVIKEEKADGSAITREFDNAGRMVAMTDAAGRKTEYRLNIGSGNVTEIVAPDGRSVRFSYNDQRQLISTTEDGLTRQMEYDPAGRVTRLVNENGASTAFTYDLMDRLTQQTGFDGRTQRYHHSVTGQLVCSEDENLVTLWHYDTSDRLTHRTVDDEPAEQWQYNERGWLTELSHLSDGHRAAVQYEYDKQGRMSLERQTVQNPETNELLWQHVTRHDYPKGLATRTTSDSLPPVEWLTYGSGYISGMKLGDTPLVDFSRDRLHRETLRSFGAYEQNSIYTATGQLLSQTFSDPVLNREYGYNDSEQLIRISGTHQQNDWQYDAAGRLISARHRDQWQQYATDPAGNRLADRAKYPVLPSLWQDNRISEDAQYFYHHDAHGRLTQKDERRIRNGGGYVHSYHYDNQHRLAHYRREQQGVTLLESRYLYDPLGRRLGKRVWKSKRERSSLSGEEYVYLNKTPEVTWYGWDGDRLTTTQTETQRIQTIYTPGSFTPLVRIETDTAELAKAVHRSLAEKFQQEANVTFPPELVTMVDSLEAELTRGELSEPNRAWLAQGGLTPEQIQNQMEPEYTPQRKIHLYHCDHRGLPLALVNVEGKADWSAEYDAWGNMLRENSPHNLVQHIRLPGQQYDEETGLYYNRHRYYDPLQGQYITQDPIGMMGGWNPYIYPLNPVMDIDPLGLMAFGGEFGKWAGSAVNAASEGHMSYEDATAAIDAANGPTYSSLLFSLSLDVGLSAYGITGGSVAAGILTGNGDNGLDLCAYAMACQGGGIGAAGGASLSGTVTNAPPTSGVSYYKGVTTDVGLVANGAVTVLSESNGVDDPMHISATLSGGLGGGEFTGFITCQQYTKCIVN
ncbi:RHS repeat protein [Salmonella enterica]|nr:RHS repeat-associated core domain-containing protein [Salmonella enterica]EBR0111030.1 RHS repeat family protein [Salmonella enterica subsp. houtenae serovar Houten]EBB6987905.1 RHS repeat protein [Salmonella enterica]EBB9335070.1 RHS repeat protein [Salmonella enterica]EBC2149609.1 RHS repeat protein [Salmonella enterica]EBJ4784653.1 RHS repeat family protein [Salmonella enterica]